MDRVFVDEALTKSDFTPAIMSVSSSFSFIATSPNTGCTEEEEDTISG